MGEATWPQPWADFADLAFPGLGPNDCGHGYRPARRLVDSSFLCDGAGRCRPLSDAHLIASQERPGGWPAGPGCQRQPVVVRSR